MEVYMNNKNDQLKIWVIERYLSGENPISIVKSIGKSKSWFYKWLNRYNKNNPLWYKEKSKTPKDKPSKTSYKIEEAIKSVRLHLYNNGLFHGAQAIQWEFKDMNINPIPSLRTINRILHRNNLTHRRTGKYIPKGTPYPKVIAEFPNHIHQADRLLDVCRLHDRGILGHVFDDIYGDGWILEIIRRDCSDVAARLASGMVEKALLGVRSDNGNIRVRRGR